MHLLAIIWTSAYLAQHYNIYVVNPTVPAAVAAELNESFATHDVFVATVSSLVCTGRVLQCDHNRRSLTFAGEFALTAKLKAAMHFLALLYHVPAIVGRISKEEGLAVFDVVGMIVDSVLLLQSLTMPKIIQNISDEDEQ